MSAPQSPSAPAPTYDARRIHTRIGTGGIGKDVIENENAVAIMFECPTKAQADALYLAIETMWRKGLFKIECKPHPRAEGERDG